MNSVTFGPCDTAPKEVPLASQERQDDLAYYISLYASFEADTPAGALRFTGAGPAVATPAEQRMMAEWASLVAQEAETGRADASWGLALTWHREGGFAGFCDDLAVYGVGNGLPSTCQTEPPTNLGKRWLAAGQTDQLFNWIDTLASFEYGKKDPATADAMTVQLGVCRRRRRHGDRAGSAGDARLRRLAHHLWCTGHRRALHHGLGGSAGDQRAWKPIRTGG